MKIINNFFKKSLSLATVLLFSTFGSYAQTPTVTWAKSAGGTGVDDAWDISHDALGNTYVTGGFNGSATFGSTTLTSGGGREMFIAKYGPSGNVLWAKSGGTSGSDRGTAIITDANGNSYVTGYFDAWSGTGTFGSQSVSTTSNTYDMFVAKYDVNGTCLWATAVNGNDDDDWPNDIALDANNNVYITGYFAGIADFGAATLNSGGSGQTGKNIFIAKYNSAGVNQWAKDGGGNHEDVGYGIDVDATGNVYATGMFRNTGTFGTFTLVAGGTNIQDVYLVKYNTSGVEQWAVKGTGTSSNSGKSVKVDGNGDIITTGMFSGSATFGTTTISSTNSSYDLYVAKYTSSGTLTWISQAGGVDDNIPNEIDFDSNNNIYVFGTMTNDMLFGTTALPNLSPGMGYDDPFLAGYDGNGNFLFAKNGGDGYSDSGRGLTIDDDDNIYLAGTFDEDCCGAPGAFDGVTIAGGNDNNDNDVFIVKLSSQSDILYSVNNVDCNGNFTGSIDITTNFGNPPYSYSWTGPNGFTSISEDLSNLEDGMYDIIITDASSNTATETITVVDPPLLVLTAGQNFPATACNVSDGGAHIIVSGGTELTFGGTPYDYLWNDPAAQTSQLATQLYPGPVTISVTDLNGCTDNLTIIVEPYSSDNDILTLTLPAQTGVANISAVNHTVTIEVSAGTGLNNLSPAITFSDCATMNPSSGSAQDFSTGVVTYTVTALDGTPQIWMVSVTEEASTGNSAFDLERSISFYPNPINDVLTIEVNDIDVTQINIININGQIVYKGYNKDRRQTIGTSNWSKGIYMIQVVSRDKTSTYKLVK